MRISTAMLVVYTGFCAHSAQMTCVGAFLPGASESADTVCISADDLLLSWAYSHKDAWWPVGLKLGRDDGVMILCSVVPNGKSDCYAYSVSKFQWDTDGPTDLGTQLVGPHFSLDAVRPSKRLLALHR